MKKFATIFMFLLLLTACSTKNTTKKHENLQVYTTIYPLYYFTHKIGGDKVNVIPIIPAGADPHNFEPSAKITSNIMKSDVFIYNGLGIEPWVKNMIENFEENPPLQMNSSNFVDKIKKGNQFDPHIWLDLENALTIATEVKNILIKADKKNENIYTNNFNLLKLKLRSLNNKYKTQLKNLKSNKLVTAHAAFAYLSKRYGLEQIPIAGIDSHEEPSAAHMVKLVKFIKANNIKTIFVEPMTSKKLANIISVEAKITTESLNPLGTLTLTEQKAGKDYLSIMESNLTAMVRGLNR